ncbi:T9SS type A sorting domain-containing protein [Dyadobacter sp. OTU695]|uniref:T9SS type A sorting domain-containing protein n=1 Tax=Dyadobacter sp. OTU695 TaxID=3043860 RepID=UPI00313E216E
MKTLLSLFITVTLVLISLKANAQLQDLSQPHKGFTFSQKGSLLTALNPSSQSTTVDLSKPAFIGKAVAFTYSAKKRAAYQRPEKVISSAGIFPNPASESVTLSLDGEWNFPVEARLFDKNGNLIRLLTVETAETSLNISKLHPGIYIVDLRAKNDHSVCKLVVQ